jgi:hypothetical protein
MEHYPFGETIEIVDYDAIRGNLNDCGLQIADCGLN